MQVKAQEMAVLRAVAALTRQAGVPPTVREVQRWAGLSSTSVATYWLAKLRSQGFVEWRASSNRTLQVTQAGRSVLEFSGVA
jgi:SOS-response transcriptional repressor LexA